MLPMSKSITAVIFLFLLMERWTELLWDMIVVRSDNMLTLNVLLSQMFGPYGSYPGPLYAASVLLTVPIIIMFAIFGKSSRKACSSVSNNQMTHQNVAGSSNMRVCTLQPAYPGFS